MYTNNQVEKAILAEKLNSLKNQFEMHKVENSDEFKTINNKLDAIMNHLINKK